VQATCDRVVIISDGRLVADGRPDELIAREKSNRFRLLLENGPAPEDVRGKLQSIPGVTGIEAAPADTTAHEYLVTTDGAADIRRDLYRAAVDNQWPLLELERRGASLGEVFGRLTRSDSAKTVTTTVTSTQEAA
jgi:ABC-2 type transport system ATP-binding protein